MHFFKKIVVAIYVSGNNFLKSLSCVTRSNSASMSSLVFILGSLSHYSIEWPIILQHWHLWYFRFFCASRSFFSSSSSSTSFWTSCFCTLQPFWSLPFLPQHHQMRVSGSYWLQWMWQLQLKFEFSWNSLLQFLQVLMPTSTLPFRLLSLMMRARIFSFSSAEAMRSFWTLM